MKTKSLMLAAILAAVSLAALAASNGRVFFDDVKINGAVAENVTRLSNPDDPEDGEVIAIAGLPSHKAFSSDDRALWLPRYHRPEKPEQVIVTIHTKDGRKWIARWEEAK